MEKDESGGVVQLEVGARHGFRRAEDQCRRQVPAASDELRRERRVQQRVADGDAAAWVEIVDAHLERVWSLALLLADDPGQAAAVCETVWLRLTQHLPLPEGELLGTWLARAVWEQAQLVARADAVVGRRRADAPPRGRVLVLPQPRGKMP